MLPLISLFKELVTTSLQIATSPGVTEYIHLLDIWNKTSHQRAVDMDCSSSHPGEMLFPNCTLVKYHWTVLKNLILKRKPSQILHPIKYISEDDINCILLFLLYDASRNKFLYRLIIRKRCAFASNIFLSLTDTMVLVTILLS